MSTDYSKKRFLYAEDLLVSGKFRTVDLIISEYHPAGTMKTDAKRDSDRKPIDKDIIGFEGKSKMLVLASTNSTLIHIITGEPPGKGWVGKKIKLQARNVPFGKDTVLGLRVIPPPGTVIRKGLVKHLGTPAVWSGQESTESVQSFSEVSTEGVT